MPLSRPLLARLRYDLAELLEAPYPGVDVFIDDADIQKFCLILTPPSGPWTDLSLHFDVVLPDNWPSSPPSVYSSISGIQHPNLFGQWICCDLLRDRWELREGYTGGYTPALTLRGLFLQFLTFFSSTKVEQDYGDPIYIGDHYFTRYEIDTGKGDLEKLWNSSVGPEVEEDSIIGTTCTRKSAPVCLRRYQRLNPRWESTYKLISQWHCKVCPYGSDIFPVHSIDRGDEMKCDLPTSSLLIAPSACVLGILNDDILLNIADHLPSESLISFSKAYPRFQELTTTAHILLQRELRCFFLRTPLRDSVLGIGVTIERTSGRLYSDFDWLSKAAFSEHGVRRSIEKREFDLFLPLAFSRAHFKRVEAQIWTHLRALDQTICDAEGPMVRRTGRISTRQTTTPTQPHQTVHVIFRMMNNIVVSLMNSCDDALDGPRRLPAKAALLHASEKAVVSYCHLFHLLLCLCHTTPVVLHEATARVLRFIQKPAFRNKTQVPDLGELIIVITLVLALPPAFANPVSWDQINGPFLEETIVRNVRWVLKDAPELEVMETGPNDYRLQKTFDKSQISLRLMMFQITFLDIFIRTYAGNISRLDDNYGFPEPGLPERMVEEIKAIYNVNTWPDFFQRVQYTRGIGFGKERFSELLRTAVRTSGQRGYHTPKSKHQLGGLALSMTSLEKKWTEA